MHRRAVALAIVLAACATAPPPPSRPVPDETPAPPPRVRPPVVQTGLEGLRGQLQPLRSVPENPAAIPVEARPYLRAVRSGLREWLLERVRSRGGVPPRVVLRAELDVAELTITRAGEELAWGSVTRLDVLAPGDGLTAVIVGMRLACASDDALYVFRGAALVMELAQDQWSAPADGRADLRVLAARASRLDGVLMVTSRAMRCGSRWQEVRFEGIAEGSVPDRPVSRWDLRQTVDTERTCGAFDEASLGIELSRNGFEMRGCVPAESGDARERRARYRFTHDGVERVER